MSISSQFLHDDGQVLEILLFTDMMLADDGHNDRNDGHMIVNIMNPKVKNVVYPSCDELVDLLRPHFKGQIGMRIMQRPQGKSVFKDEEGNFDKEQLQDYFDQLYIENCWYFGKEDTPDIFLRAEKNNLDDFFA